MVAAKFGGRRIVGIAKSVVLPWETWKTRAFDPVTLDRVAAWRSNLSASQSRDIAAVCQRQMRLLGYDPSMRGVEATLRRLSLPLAQQKSRMSVRAALRADLNRIQRAPLDRVLKVA